MKILNSKLPDDKSLAMGKIKDLMDGMHALTYTLSSSISLKSFITLALKAAKSVNTGGIRGAVCHPSLTLIDSCTM